MDLVGKVAVVTGGTDIIGKAVALKLVAEGMNVFITSRSEQSLHDMENCDEAFDRIYPVLCDMTKERDVKDLFSRVQEKFKALHVLINNAGTAMYTQITDCETEKWKHMFERNVIGVGMATREALKVMAATHVRNGYIINISSISAHGIPTISGKHVYNASKHAMRIITEGLREELTEQKSRIRVSMISPGTVRSELSAVGGWLGMELNIQRPTPYLKGDDVSDMVLLLLSLPPDVHMTDMIVRPLWDRFLY